MKSAIIALSLSVMLFGAVAPAETQGPKSVLTPQMVDASAWRTPDKLRKKLAAEILKALPSVKEKRVSAFLKKAENRRLLYMYHLACAETSAQEGYKKYNNNLNSSVQGKKDEITRLEKEVSSKTGPEKKRAEYLLDCAKSDLKNLQKESKYPANLGKCQEVLKQILSDAGWMEQIAFSGEMYNFTRVVQIIAAIAAEDAQALNKGVERDTTTAIALEYARYGGHLTAAVERAQYFLKYWRLGRLNTSYDDLPIHQRRIVCGWKIHHSSGTIKAFEWALNNVHLPDWQYPSSCWRCGYILDNVYGDSIHGPWYVAPFVGVYTDNHMAFTKHVGGVCGGLSHFGAASACANGVPALTAGEPGHCAYLVLVNGRWTPAYSLTWERGLHWIPWDNNWTFSALHLTDDLYAKDNAKKARLSNAYRILAQAYTDKGDDEKTLACYEESTEAAPLNYPVWREYSSFLSSKMPQNKDAWKKLNKTLCSGVASAYPEQAAELLRQYVYGKLPSAGLSVKELVDCCALFWKHADKMGPDRWRIEALTSNQLQMCKNAGGTSESAIIDLYVNVLAAAAPHSAYSGTMMTWGNNLSSSLSEAGKKQLMDTTLEMLGKGKALDEEQKAKLLGGLLLTAERARDAETFYSISKMIDKKLIKGAAPIPDFPSFPGKLVSEGGLPFASSTSEWDAPHTHSGFVTKSGGRIHTAKEKNPWIAVKLPKHAYVTGVVFMGTNEWSLIHRFRPIKVQVSDTGRDDDWHDVGEPIPNTGNYVNRFDLQKERPKALYIRVMRPGGPEVFHANGMYVFGEPAA